MVSGEVWAVVVIVLGGSVVFPSGSGGSGGSSGSWP